MAEPQRFDRKTFLEWKQHPLTGLFLQYLEDYRAELARMWSTGQEMAPRQQFRAEMAGDLARLDWASVAEFYDLPFDETESAAQ